MREHALVCPSLPHTPLRDPVSTLAGLDGAQDGRGTGSQVPLLCEFYFLPFLICPPSESGQ